MVINYNTALRILGSVLPNFAILRISATVNSKTVNGDKFDITDHPRTEQFKNENCWITSTSL